MQVSVPRLPYDNDQPDTASDKLSRCVTDFDRPMYPCKDIYWAIVHSDEYGYNDKFFSESPVSNCQRLLDLNWSDNADEILPLEDLAEAGIIVCLYKGLTTFVFPDFTYAPEYYQYDNRTYAIDPDTQEQLKREGLFLCLYPQFNKVGTRFGNGKGFMHYHGGGTDTCMGTDSQNLYQGFSAFNDVDSLFHFRDKLERRFNLINADSYLHRSPRNLPLSDDDLYHRKSNLFQPDRRGF